MSFFSPALFTQLREKYALEKRKPSKNPDPPCAKWFESAWYSGSGVTFSGRFSRRTFRGDLVLGPYDGVHRLGYYRKDGALVSSSRPDPHRRIADLEELRTALAGFSPAISSLDVGPRDRARLPGRLAAGARPPRDGDAR